jgi:hypothetical protein
LTDQGPLIGSTHEEDSNNAETLLASPSLTPLSIWIECLSGPFAYLLSKGHAKKEGQFFVFNFS